MTSPYNDIPPMQHCATPYTIRTWVLDQDESTPTSSTNRFTNTTSWGPASQKPAARRLEVLKATDGLGQRGQLVVLQPQGPQRCGSDHIPGLEELFVGDPQETISRRWLKVWSRIMWCVDMFASSVGIDINSLRTPTTTTTTAATTASGSRHWPTAPRAAKQH